MTTLSIAPVAHGSLRRHVMVLGLLWAAIVLIFLRDFVALVEIWWTSSTFAHCLLIPPIICWLVWQRWPELGQLVPRGWLAGLLLVGAGAGAWLLGEAAGVALARHLGLVLMLQGAVVAILGPEVSRGLIFPLAYMLFLVPAGEGLVPPLQTLTAKICMLLLGIAGIPAHIQGVFITIPNGWFEVAEACSGVKFLIAMAAYGVLVAHVCFKSWPRRIAFVGAALILPIIANGVRAWGTIYMAYRTNAHFAEGFDHVIYGWVFFGIVIALLMGASWYWFDRSVGDRWIDVAALRPPVGTTDRVAPAAGGAVLIALLALGWSAFASSGGASLTDAELPDLKGWQRVAPPSDWSPNFAGADRFLRGSYVDARGRKVDLSVAVFASQAEGRELVGYGQGAVGPESRWAWTDNQLSPPNGRAFRITGPGGVVRDILIFYRVGNVTTGSEFRVKAETLKVKLLGGPRRGIAIMLSSVEPAPGHSARPALDAFMARLGPVDHFADTMADEAN